MRPIQYLFPVLVAGQLIQNFVVVPWGGLQNFNNFGRKPTLQRASKLNAVVAVFWDQGPHGV
jgi:hypothetical protein